MVLEVSMLLLMRRRKLMTLSHMVLIGKTMTMTIFFTTTVKPTTLTTQMTTLS
jgi:uncharacterized membrane protein YczE